MQSGVSNSFPFFIIIHSAIVCVDSNSAIVCVDSTSAIPVTIYEHTRLHKNFFFFTMTDLITYQNIDPSS